MSDPCGGNETPLWSAPGPRPPPHGAGAVGLESRDTGRALPKARRHAPLDHGETAERGVLGHCHCQRHAAHSHPGGQPLHPEAARRSRCSRAAQNSRGVDEARADDAGGRRDAGDARGRRGRGPPGTRALCTVRGGRRSFPQRQGRPLEAQRRATASAQTSPVTQGPGRPVAVRAEPLGGWRCRGSFRPASPQTRVPPRAMTPRAATSLGHGNVSAPRQSRGTRRVRHPPLAETWSRGTRPYRCM